MGLAPLLLLAATLPQRPAQPLPRTGPQPAPTAATPASGDEAVLRAAHLADSGPELLRFFRLRTPPAPGPDRLAELVGQLGDGNQAVRERAAGELVGLGPCAVPALRRAANDLERAAAAAQARACLQAVEGPAGTQLVLTAAHRLARRKPAGAAEALLAYLPFADDENVLRGVEESLAAVGLRDGKPDPALHAARAEVLGLIGQLDDLSAEVRQKASDSLTAFGARAAPLLRQAAGRGPTRLGEAAAKCLEEIERDGANPLPAAAPRLLALRKP